MRSNIFLITIMVTLFTCTLARSEISTPSKDDTIAAINTIWTESPECLNYYSSGENDQYYGTKIILHKFDANSAIGGELSLSYTERTISSGRSDGDEQEISLKISLSGLSDEIRIYDAPSTDSANAKVITFIEFQCINAKCISNGLYNSSSARIMICSSNDAKRIGLAIRHLLTFFPQDKTLAF